MSVFLTSGSFQVTEQLILELLTHVKCLGFWEWVSVTTQVSQLIRHSMRDHCPLRPGGSLPAMAEGSGRDTWVIWGRGWLRVESLTLNTSAIHLGLQTLLDYSVDGRSHLISSPLSYSLQTAHSTSCHVYTSQSNSCGLPENPTINHSCRLWELT